MTDEQTSSRRTVLKAAGATAIAATSAGAFVTTTGAVDGGEGWSPVQNTPTGKSITAVVDTVEGPYAVGSSGNILTRSGGAWSLVVDSGPATKNNGLNDVAVTDDGKRIWFNGGSGALGAYDVVTGRKHDYTAPKEKTSTWESIGVTGNMESETIIPANGSGEVLPGWMNNKGCIEWGTVTKPGSGSTIPGVTFRTNADGEQFAYAIDTSQNVFRSADSGSTWTDIGIENAQVAFYDVLGTTDSVLVAGGSGRLYRRDCLCNRWTPIDIGEKSVHALSKEGDRVLASAASGHVYERASDGWTEMETDDTQADLLGITHGTELNVAVGSSGTIITNS